MAAQDVAAHKAEYTIDETLENGLVLLRKTEDGTEGERSLGCILPPEAETNPETQKMLELDNRGAGESLMNLLNHENLVNLQTALIHQPTIDSNSPPRPQTVIVWDWCDAGTLQDIFDDPPVFYPLNPGSVAQQGEGGEFLPEGLIWHVALGILRALQWLHDGVRDTYTVKGPVFPLASASAAPKKNKKKNEYFSKENSKIKAESFRTRCQKVRGTTTPEADWWPILHRGILPENIFFQHPRGIESYGPVKLGNFEKAFVSGTLNIEDLTPKWSDEERNAPRPTVMAMEVPGDDVGIEGVRHRYYAWKDVGVFGVPREERPYTVGSELYALGVILFRMMTGLQLPPSDQCPLCSDPDDAEDGECFHIHYPKSGEDPTRPPAPPALGKCKHDCVYPNVNFYASLQELNYSYSLKDMVINLLYLNHDVKQEKRLTGRILRTYWPSYVAWCEGTDEGRRHRDLFDDLWVREVARGWSVVEGVVADVGQEKWEDAGESGSSKKRKGGDDDDSEEEPEWDGSTVRVTRRGTEFIYLDSESDTEDEVEVEVVQG